MGLDMYLWRVVHMPWNKQDMLLEVIVEDNQGNKLPIRQDKLSSFKEELAYWRKANHIHKWFVDNVQSGTDDCKTYYVSSEKLTELLNLCKQVLKYKNKELTEEDKDTLDELLPTADGFFFGSTEYNQYYFEDIEETINMIEPVLLEDIARDMSFGVSYYYEASW